MTVFWIILAFAVGFLIAWRLLRLIIPSMVIIALKRAGVTPQQAEVAINGMTGAEVAEDIRASWRERRRRDRS